VATSSVTFSTSLNTSSVVPEYPLVSRALMLSGGSTDSALGDLNGDGLADLVVSVSDSREVAVFFRRSSGDMPSNPSMTIPLPREPISVAVADLFLSGVNQVVVLEKKNTAFDSDQIEFYNVTSETTYELIMNRQPVADASQLIVANLTGDPCPDISVAVHGQSPDTSSGEVQLFVGPFFSSSLQLLGGRGSNSIAVVDSDGDGRLDLSLANYYDDNVMVFEQPFVNFMMPTHVLSLDASPTSLACGKLDSDSLDDLVVASFNQSIEIGKLSFFFQSLGQLPLTESLNVTLDLNVTTVAVADTDSDGGDELVLALSQSDNAAAGFLRKSTTPIWRGPADYRFPTGTGPRQALFGSFDSTGNLGVAISSAGPDWSGSSLAIFPDVTQCVSNSNRTLWGSRDFAADSVCTGDINDDGITDIVFRYSSADAFGYMLSGSGPVSVIGLGYTPSCLIVQDFDRDGYDDILTAESGGNHSTVCFGSSSGLAAATSQTSSGDIISTAVGDFDHDSWTDMVTATGNGELNIFFNQRIPSDSFGDPVEVTLGTTAGAISVGDFDSDGRDDIAYSHPARSISILMQADSEPFISTPAGVNLSAPAGSDFTEIWGGDINGDGRTDLVGKMPADPMLYLFDQNDFATSPHPFATLDLPEDPQFVSVMDVTDDGHADVVATFDSADMLFLYRQDGGVLPEVPSMTFVTGARPNWVTMGDGTGDGRIDLLVSCANSRCVSVWEMINSCPLSVAGGPYEGVEGEPVVFAGHAETQVSEISITDFFWDFGDGSNSGWSHGGAVPHTYTLQKTYNATLTVRDPFNPALSNSSATAVVISDALPQVSFTWAPLAPDEGELVYFNDTSTSFDAITLMNWTVDGSLASSGLDHSIHQRLDNGTHAVSLEITDSDGSTNSTTHSVTVGRLAPTVVLASPEEASEGVAVLFTAIVDEWHSTVDTVTSYEWNYSYTGGGFVPDPLGGFTGTVNHTTHIFQSSAVNANYTVAVRVTDEDGDVTIAFTNITIYDMAVVTVLAQDSDSLYEYRQVNFTVTVDSAFSPISFDWDFDAPQNGFEMDSSTSSGGANHTYTGDGNYLVKVRVSMSNGSLATGSAYVTVSDLGLYGTSDQITVSRDPSDTCNISLDAREFALRFPDITGTTWTFGDSSDLTLAHGPNEVISHTYDPSSDYTVTLTMTDDDGNTLVLHKTLKLIAPRIELRSPDSGSVTRSGTVIQYSISDDSQSLVSVQYALDFGTYQNFSVQWEISSSDWTDGVHAVVVRAEDPDGNVNYSEATLITIDDIAPVVTVTTNATSVFGGSKLNITADIDDPNVASGGVLLYVRFPGDEAYASFPMSSSSQAHYYRVIEVPSRSGHMEYYIVAKDLANNSAQTPAGSIEIKMHLMDVALPYLLLATVVLVLGVAAYLTREARNAVDETFVIYNDGRLISHSTRRLKPGMDDQILSSMLAAIQDFVKESFKDVTSFNIRRLEFGDKNVLIEKGDNLFLAVILHGKASKKIASRMRGVVAEIEGRFEEHLTDWDGDLDKVRGVTDIVKKLYSKAPLLAPAIKRRD